MRKTPLYDEAKDLGGKIVEYSGWLLPVQYQGIISEHLAVRNSAGLFDVSHMGEIRVSGAEAVQFLQLICTRDLGSLAIGRISYTLMCDESGGVIDDLLVYRLGEEEYLLVVNAANTGIDFQWLKSWQEKLYPELKVENVSDEFAQIALQGPRSMQILSQVAPEESVKELRTYSFTVVRMNREQVIISRTGYTGEDGYELYMPPAIAPAMWKEILAAGAGSGIVPAGLGARDSLRLEAGMPLYGHEISREINPLEAGLDAFVNSDTKEFHGREALELSRTRGIKRKITGLCLQDRAIARQGYKIFNGDKEIGQVTSGIYSPYLEKSICMALLQKEEINGKQSRLEVEIRGRRHKVEICPLPFYKRQRK